MYKLINSLSKLGWRRIAFSVIVLTYLGFLLFINLLMVMPGNFISAMGHFSFINTGDTHNLVHELVFAIIVGMTAVGLFSQLRKPENFAGQLIALIAWVAIIATGMITNNLVPHPLLIIFGGLTLLATILHPSGLGLFSWICTAKVNKILIALTIIVAVPLTVFAFTNINLQIAGDSGFPHNPPAFHGDIIFNQEINQYQPLNNSDNIVTNKVDHEHAEQGHYRNMAAFSFIIVLMSILTSLKPKGRRLIAWSTGLLSLSLGLISVILLDAESSLGLFWGLAAIFWGIVFVAAAEITDNC